MAAHKLALVLIIQAAVLLHISLAIETPRPAGVSDAGVSDQWFPKRKLQTRHGRYGSRFNLRELVAFLLFAGRPRAAFSTLSPALSFAIWKCMASSRHQVSSYCLSATCIIMCSSQQPRSDDDASYARAAAPSRPLTTKPTQPLTKTQRRRQKKFEKAQKQVASVEAPPTGWPGGVASLLQDKGGGIHIPVVNAWKVVNWSSAPEAVDPTLGGGLQEKSRGLRKKIAAESIARCVSDIFVTGNGNLGPSHVLDLGSGTGNLALPLSWLLGSQCGIVAVDIKKSSLDILAARAAISGLNITTVVGDFLDKSILPQDGVDCIVSLHACGAASDLAINAALALEVPFVVAPCCFGKAVRKRSETDWENDVTYREAGRAPESVMYPRSSWLRKQLGSDAEQKHARLAIAASFVGGAGIDASVPWNARWQVAQAAQVIIEVDRLEFCRERGYATRLVAMPDADVPNITKHPKNLYHRPELILIGTPIQIQKVKVEAPAKHI